MSATFATDQPAGGAERRFGPGTEQAELEWMLPSYVPMEPEEWEETVDLFAELLKPVIERVLERRKLTKGSGLERAA